MGMSPAPSLLYRLESLVRLHCPWCTTVLPHGGGRVLHDVKCTSLTLSSTEVFVILSLANNSCIFPDSPLSLLVMFSGIDSSYYSGSLNWIPLSYWEITMNRYRPPLGHSTWGLLEDRSNVNEVYIGATGSSAFRV